MKEIRYALLDPTGNLTVLVESEIPPEKQPSVAARIMEYEPSAEQVGFLSPRFEGVAMRMAGGEFCGNAAMSAAALFALDHGIADGTVSVAVSGEPAPVTVCVSALPDGSMRGEEEMPRPVSVGEERFPDGATRPVVRFHGISHVILETPLERDEAEKLAPVWCRFLGAASLGIMTVNLTVDRLRGAGTLLPLVYVPAAGTLFWENSCASGTTAVGAYFAAKEGVASLSLRQPGGVLRVDAAEDGGLRLTGTVRLLHRRTVEVGDAAFLKESPAKNS